MSRSQFHSIKLFILRHAWLNLWDKHMTTGRINQVTFLTVQAWHPTAPQKRRRWSHARHSHSPQRRSTVVGPKPSLREPRKTVFFLFQSWFLEQRALAPEGEASTPRLFDSFNFPLRGRCTESWQLDARKQFEEASFPTATRLLQAMPTPTPSSNPPRRASEAADTVLRTFFCFQCWPSG